MPKPIALKPGTLLFYGPPNRYIAVVTSGPIYGLHKAVSLTKINGWKVGQVVQLSGAGAKIIWEPSG